MLCVALTSACSREEHAPRDALDIMASTPSPPSDDLGPHGRGYGSKFIVLSDTFGLCVPRNIFEGKWKTTRGIEFSAGEFTFSDETGSHIVSFASGPVSLPGVRLHRIDDGKSSKRIRAGLHDSLGVIAVDGIAPDRESRMLFEHKASDLAARNIALEIAQEVVACDVVLRTTETPATPLSANLP